MQFTHGAFASPEHVAHIGQWYDTILKETRRPLIGESIRHFWSEPDLWRKQLNDVEERCRQGYAAYAMTSTRRTLRRWTLKDSSRFDEISAWKTLMTMPLELRKILLGDPKTRDELDKATTEGKPINFSRRWDLVSIKKAARAENRPLEGKNIDELARLQAKSPIGAFLDLALAEDLETTFEDTATQGDDQAVKEIFCSPHVLLGQSDAGAHVANANPGFGFATTMLAYWVRERQIMSLEDAIKKLTFLPASIFGIHDRGLLRRGLAADLSSSTDASKNLQFGLDGRRQFCHIEFRTALLSYLTSKQAGSGVERAPVRPWLTAACGFSPSGRRCGYRTRRCDAARNASSESLTQGPRGSIGCSAPATPTGVEPRERTMTKLTPSQTTELDRAAGSKADMLADAPHATASTIRATSTMPAASASSPT